MAEPGDQVDLTDWTVHVSDTDRNAITAIRFRPAPPAPRSAAHGGEFCATRCSAGFGTEKSERILVVVRQYLCPAP